jgi:hypothetical protein
LTFDEQLQRALDTFSTRLQEEVTHQVRVVGDELAAAVRAQQVSLESSPSTERLADGIRTMSDAHSLSEVLDALVRCAGREAPRVGVLLVRGDRFHGWRFLGFDPLFESEPVDIAHDVAGVIAEAVRKGRRVSSEPNGTDHAPVFAHLTPGQGCLAVPLSIGGQAVAVLYADSGQKPEVSKSEPRTLNPEPGTLNPEPIDILTRFASQRLEALTAIKAVRSLTANAEPPAPTTGQSDDSDEHSAARRYARLLVSEIKLYYEPQVAEGRRERDLATRLGGEIARVRTLYEQRVPAEVRQNTDYVHEELIRMLADGDASLLEAKA